MSTEAPNSELSWGDGENLQQPSALIWDCLCNDVEKSLSIKERGGKANHAGKGTEF